MLAGAYAAACTEYRHENLVACKLYSANISEDGGNAWHTNFLPQTDVTPPQRQGSRLFVGANHAKKDAGWCLKNDTHQVKMAESKSRGGTHCHGTTPHATPHTPSPPLLAGP